MPAGNTSLQSYIPTVFTTQSPTAYKSNLDGDTSIVGNPAGMFYVYPTTPATMQVNVDIGFTYLKTQVGFALNNGGASTTVALVAPGSNSYYATVCYDTVTNTFVAIYGASAVTPTPVMPDHLHRIPLAFVLLASTTTQVQATNITDCRWVQLVPLGLTGNFSANTAFDVRGASRVDLNMIFSVSLTITLNNLQEGAHVKIIANNSQLGALTLKIAANAPSGTPYLVTGVTAGGALVNLQTVGHSQPANLTTVYSLFNAPPFNLAGGIFGG